MRRTVLLVAAVLSGWIARPAPGADGGAEAAFVVAPVVGAETVVVARIDLPRIDSDAWFDLVAPLVPEPAEVKDVARKTVRAWLDAWRKAGGREVYLVYGLGDVPEPPCLLTPVADDLERNDLAGMLQMLVDHPRATHARVGKLLCVGTEGAVKRFRQRKPVPRPDLAEAFAATGAGPVRVVFSPPADTRKVLEEVVDDLPPEVGGGSVRILTRGFRWLALGLDGPPKLQVRLTVQAASPDAAERLGALVGRALTLVRQAPVPEDDDPRSAVLPKVIRRLTQLFTPKVEKDRLVVQADLTPELPDLLKLTQGVRSEASRARSINNLKQLGVALHGYHDVYGYFPTDIRSPDGKPLLSWRVAILPFVGQQNLYNRFKLDEPWDSEHNRKLISQMPAVYRSPKQADRLLKDYTTYVAPVGKGLVWDEPRREEVPTPMGGKAVVWKGTEIKEITDGTSSTILLVEADDDVATVWTKPADRPIDPADPAKHLLGHYPDGILTLLADGSVRLLPKKLKPKVLYLYFTRAGGEPIPED